MKIIYSQIISVGNTGLHLAQNCPDNSGIRITEGPLCSRFEGIWQIIDIEDWKSVQVFFFGPVGVKISKNRQFPEFQQWGVCS